MWLLFTTRNVRRLAARSTNDTSSTRMSRSRCTPSSASGCALVVSVASSVTGPRNAKSPDVTLRHRRGLSVLNYPVVLICTTLVTLGDYTISVKDFLRETVDLHSDAE